MDAAKIPASPMMHFNIVTLTVIITIFLHLQDVFPFKNSLQDLDPSSKMDLDLWDCFGRENTKLQLYYARLILHIFNNFRRINFSLMTK